jgi:hypothetical protein
MNYQDLFMQQGERVMVKAPYIKVYIPIDYMEHRIAEIIGQDIRTMGLFYFDVFDFDNNDNLKLLKRYFLTIPTYITMSPSKISTERDEDKRIVNVFEFKYGDIFINSTLVKQDWKVVSNMIEILIQGFMPSSIGYDEMYSIISECTKINDIDFKISDMIMELLIAELNRDPNNIRRPFRLALKDDPNISMNLSKRIKIDVLARINNTFAAISSADPLQGVSVSINRERYNEKQIPSAIEESLKNV